MERTSVEATQHRTLFGVAVNNHSIALRVLRELAVAGVREVVLCAGARNAPFVRALNSATNVKVYSFFEERSAAFFALGRIQASGEPVAVITTSGTAVAETLPAVIEADYQSLPLVIVSADRPLRYRGCGAPQSIVQPGIFSHYVENSWDIDQTWLGVEGWSRRRPIHVNVCFEEPDRKSLVDQWTWPEPLAFVPLDGSADEFNWPADLKRPLFIVSGLTAQEAQELQPFLAESGRPLFLESSSQLRGHRTLALNEIHGGEKTLRELDFDCVIRVGGIPTLRFWRDLETLDLPVFNFSSRPFSGLPHVSRVYPLLQVLKIQTKFDSWNNQGDQKNSAQLEDLLARYPLSEPAWVRRVSEQISQGSRVFLGNSSPIREWDLCAKRELDCSIAVNRGVNGIDGLISTFMGGAHETQGNCALLGDLSALYDLSGPWALKQRPLKNMDLVILNNGGGRIFKRMFRHESFENPHQLQFENWAAMWGMQYMRLEHPLLWAPSRDPRVIEIAPDLEQTEAFWNEWEKP